MTLDAIRRRVKLLRSEARPAEPGTLWGEVEQLCADAEKLLALVEAARRVRKARTLIQHIDASLELSEALKDLDPALVEVPA